MTHRRRFLTASAVAVAVLLAPAAAMAQDEAAVRAAMDLVNVQLAAAGLDYRVEVAEFFTNGDQAGTTVFFNNRGNKQLAYHFVPNDPRRAWGTTDGITYALDGPDGSTSSGLTSADTTAEIDAAMATWEAQRCSDVGITRIGVFPIDIGNVQFQLGFGGFPGVAADIMHAGWLPGAFFDALAPGGGSFILGVTFTFIFVDGGNPTDIDNNGRGDAAFREIYYNDAFPWAIGSTFDVQTVALHESGHGLSQAHFGKAFGTNANGKIHFAPRAVMNAAYSGVQLAPAGSDNGGHCSIWGSWPMR